MENREYISPTIASVGPTAQALVALNAVAAVNAAVVAHAAVVVVSLMLAAIY